MALAPGSRLGPYEIADPLGAGGMGEVYRARDTRLERTVAIKVLPRDLTGRPEVLQRFEREARAISTLNHPHICTLYDVGSENGVPYLVMEYVEGETLAERLARGPLPLADVWWIAIQIGEALDHAHRHGIVHRDLKPGNVMLAGGKGGKNVKLLDFGLAKLPMAQAAAAPGSLTSLPTVAQGLTAEGMIVGTLEYMAPEQLEGAEADTRSDIFAFGCVLYEMVTGRKAFGGKSQASLISAILKDEPPSLAGAQPMAPPALDRLTRKCLAKSADDRWQTARDLVGEMRWISESSSQMAAAPATAARRRFRFQAAWIAVAVLSVAFLGLLALHLRVKPPEEHAARFTVAPPEKTSFGPFDSVSLSPDGTRMVFRVQTAQGPIFALRSIDALQPQLLPGTENAFLAFWSPDGRSLALSANGKLNRIDLQGGPAVPLSDVPAYVEGSWSPAGVILFSTGPSGPLYRVNQGGGTPAPVTRLAPRETGHLWPHFLPDGEHFLFTVSSAAPETRGIYVGSLGSPAVNRILPDETSAQYSPPGYVLFVRGDVLTAQPFDARSLRNTGDSFPVASQVAILPTMVGSLFSSAAGNLAFRVSEGFALSQLIWFDRKGARAGIVGEPSDYTDPALSPDGRMLAVCKRDPITKNRAIWLFDLVRGSSSKLTVDSWDNMNPVWSPDGRRIASSSKHRGERDLYVRAANGTGQGELLIHSDVQKNAEDWTSDAKYLLYNQGTASNRGVWALPLAGDRKPFQVLGGPYRQEESQVSPNGKWIAYLSLESGQQQVYVQNFPPAGGKWQVSTAGGSDPQWSRDGKELFYLQANKLMAVAVKTTGSSFDADVPRPLFDTQPMVTGRNRYLVSPDGQKFLISTLNVTTSQLPITVVLNWLASVKH